MSQVISADIDSSGGGEAPVATSEEGQRSDSRTALDCLARVATYHGIDMPVKRLRHAYAIDGTPPSLSLLLRMAKDAGLRARATRLDWGALFRLGEAYLVLLRLANGNWIVVLRVGWRLYNLYQAEGARQALLVETVHGMRTVKSLAMEPLQGKVWDDRRAQSVTMRFGVIS